MLHRRTVRLVRHLTQTSVEEIAEVLGVSRATAYRLEMGEYVMTPEFDKRIRQLFARKGLDEVSMAVLQRAVELTIEKYKEQGRDS